MTGLEQLAAAAVPVTFAAGEALMTQGEPGDRYIVIESGAVDVIGDGRLLQKCGPGNGIGEIALLSRVPRTATAIARSAVSGYALDAAAFLDAVAAPASSAAAALVVRERLARSARAVKRRGLSRRDRPDARS
jgi:CRP-like cAMP-binding protein